MNPTIHTHQRQTVEATPELLATMGLPGDCDHEEFQVAWTANHFEAAPRRSHDMLQALTRHMETFGGYPKQADAIAATNARFPALAADVQAAFLKTAPSKAA